MADNQAVYHHFERVNLVFVELDLFAEVAHLTVYPHTHIARPPHLLEDVAVLAFAPAHQRRQQHQPRAIGQRGDGVDDLLHRLLGDLAATDRAVRMSDTGVEQTEVVVYLGDGAYRRARVVGSALLVNRDGGRE